MFTCLFFGTTVCELPFSYGVQHRLIGWIQQELIKRTKLTEDRSDCVFEYSCLEAEKTSSLWKCGKSSNYIG